jgi:hypothetical protein
VLNYLVG